MPRLIEAFKQNIKSSWQLFLIIIVAGLFFLGSIQYNLFTQKDDFIKWLSPDETANYVFTKLYAQTGELSIYEKYNSIAEDIIRPRSFRSDMGEMKPVSFLGIILIYGSIASLTTYKIIPFLTPVFAAVAIIFYYLFIKKIFGAKNAMLSSLMLASFPVYIYYSARSMFHNVLFISLLIIGFYFLMRMADKKISSSAREQVSNWIFAALAGLFIGLAIITRTSELLWLAPILGIAWLFNIRKIGFTKLVIFLCFLISATIPVLYWNKILYSSSISSGYPEMNQSISNIASSGSLLVKSAIIGKLAGGKEILANIQNNIFHFGFKPSQSLKMAYYYFVKMFPLIFCPAAIGLILFFQKFFKWKKKHLVYMICYLFLSSVLIFYYGSWKFFDNPNPNSYTIGNSYTRYWLPIYMGAFPFASLFIIKLTKAFASACYSPSPEADSSDNQPLTAAGYLKKNFQAFKRIFFTSFGQALIICLIMFFSVQYVLFGSEEGLVYSAKKQSASAYEQKEILESTPASSVVITQYHDKLIFPERKVIVGLFNDDGMNMKYARLASVLPVYYYNFTFPEKDLKYLNEKKLKMSGLTIEPIRSVNEFTLYKLNTSKNSEN